MNTHPQADSGSGERPAFGEALGRAVGPVTIALRPAAPVLDRLTLDTPISEGADTVRVVQRFHATLGEALADGGKIRAIPTGGYTTLKVLEYRRCAGRQAGG